MLHVRKDCNVAKVYARKAVGTSAFGTWNSVSRGLVNVETDLFAVAPSVWIFVVILDIVGPVMKAVQMVLAAIQLVRPWTAPDSPTTVREHVRMFNMMSLIVVFVGICAVSMKFVIWESASLSTGLMSVLLARAIHVKALAVFLIAQACPSVWKIGSVDPLRCCGRINFGLH